MSTQPLERVGCPYTGWPVAPAEPPRRRPASTRRGFTMARGDGSIKPLTKDGTHVHRDGKPVYRVRFIDAADGQQKERQVSGLAEAETLLAKYVVHKSTQTTTRFLPVRASFDELTQAFLDDHRFKLNGERRPYSTWHKAYSNLYCYILPTLGGVRIGEMTTLALIEFIRGL